MLATDVGGHLLYDALNTQLHLIIVMHLECHHIAQAC